ncbi:helix-turn-helix domain-containing protein [Variovorax sp. S12S4]|uniref:helix-turn-helix domain-containing protein n=1 Tax=Variovorax sp. S12S4 TaxID=3029170 RepID=UPI00406CDAD4
MCASCATWCSAHGSWRPATRSTRSGCPQRDSAGAGPEPEATRGRALAPPPINGQRDAAVAPPEAGEDQIVIEVGTQLSEVERRVILATYERCGRHKERTAALLGISMKTLYNRLKEYQQ